MSISQLNANPVSLRATMAVAALRSNATSAATSPAPASAAPRQADSVNLSDTARALSAAKHSVGGATEVREDRIAAIKLAIANGTYSVESRDLARSMVRRSHDV